MLRQCLLIYEPVSSYTPNYLTSPMSGNIHLSGKSFQFVKFHIFQFRFCIHRASYPNYFIATVKIYLKFKSSE